MDSFVDMLWDQDVDMGVDRYFYDPVLREQHVKKQEAEQNKLQELKKRHAQQVSFAVGLFSDFLICRGFLELLHRMLTSQQIVLKKHLLILQFLFH